MPNKATVSAHYGFAFTSFASRSDASARLFYLHSALLAYARQTRRTNLDMSDGLVSINAGIVLVSILLSVHAIPQCIAALNSK